MIRYSLKCDKGHGFDSWFKSADAYDTLKTSGMVACAICGSTAVEKTLMAPSVRTEPGERPLADQKTPLEEAMTNLRQEVEKNSEYVGMSFASEARAMHEGEVPSRAICWWSTCSTSAPSKTASGDSTVSFPKRMEVVF